MTSGLKARIPDRLQLYLWVHVESRAGGRMGSIAVTDNTHDAMLSRVQRLDEVSEAPRVGRKSSSGREQRSRPWGA